jgi:hypothetical protein
MNQLFNLRTNNFSGKRMPRTLGKQTGAATLFIALMMLFSLTMIAVFSARTSVTEIQVTANEYRTKQALEAAQAGVEQGQVEIVELQTTNINGLLQLHQLDGNSNAGLGFVDLNPSANFFRVNGTPGALSNNSSYTLTYENIDRDGGVFDSSRDNYLIRVTSVGASDDGSAKKQIQQLMMLVPWLANTPDAALTAKELVDIGGNVAVTNMVTDLAVLAGGTYSSGGSASTETSNGSNQAGDVVQNDATLAGMTSDQFFFSFFGQSKSDIKAQSTQITCDNCNGDLDGLTGQMIWVNPATAGSTPQVNSNTLIGSATQPVILIIEGGASGFKLNGTADIYGIVYVIGDWDNSGGGNANITGAAVAEGEFHSTGTPNPTYDETVLNRLNALGTFARIPGSWKDF